MQLSYVLVTTAYNEEQIIESTIKSVIHQTHLPKKWIIVSDGSTDRTDDIIRKYAEKYQFIIYERQEKRDIDKKRIEKASIAKSRSMKLALKRLSDVEYDFIGNLDSDISFDSDYYEQVLSKFLNDSKLGIAGGGAFNVNPNGTLTGGGFIKTHFVGGPVQLFRRECYEEIGGYQPYGRDDCIAVGTAKMKGWKVRCFPEIRAFHYGTPSNKVKEKVPDCFKMGQMDYIMGDFLIFQFIRCTIRAFKKPYILAGMAMMAGYVWAFLTKRKKIPEKNLRKYMQSQQLSKLISRLRSRGIKKK